jgi:hypothetical protein
METIENMIVELEKKLSENYPPKALKRAMEHLKARTISNFPFTEDADNYEIIHEAPNSYICMLLMKPKEEHLRASWKESKLFGFDVKLSMLGNEIKIHVRLRVFV